MLRPLLRLLPQPSRRSGRKPTARRRLSLEPLEDRRLLAVWSATEDGAYFGNLDQHSLQYAYSQFGTGNDNMACGPTAATNSLVYLENAFPSLFGQSLIASAGHSMQGKSTYTTYDDWIYTAGGVLASPKYMNTTQAEGTYHDQFIWGLYKYTESVAGGKLSYAAEDYSSPKYWGNAPAPSGPPSWVKGGGPTWDFIYDGLNDSASVDVGLSYVGGGGHFISIKGMTWNDVADTGTLTFMDCWTGKTVTTDIYLNSGQIYTAYGSNGSYISSAEVLTPIDVPAVPTGQNAVADGTHAITVQWNSVDGARDYSLERWNPATVTWDQVYHGSATQYTDSGSHLRAATTYYYKICATNTAGDSAYTAAMSATTAPARPSGLSAALAGIRSVVLCWDASAGATSYTLERATSADGTYTHIYSGSATQYTDSSVPVSLGTTYYYRVKASNGSADSSYSAVTSIDPLRLVRRTLSEGDVAPSVPARNVLSAVSTSVFSQRTPVGGGAETSSILMPADLAARNAHPLSFFSLIGLPAQTGYLHAAASVVVSPEPQQAGQSLDQQPRPLVDDNSSKPSTLATAQRGDYRGPWATGTPDDLPPVLEEPDLANRDLSAFLDEITMLLAGITGDNRLPSAPIADASPAAAGRSGEVWAGAGVGSSGGALTWLAPTGPNARQNALLQLGSRMSPTSYLAPNAYRVGSSPAPYGGNAQNRNGEALLDGAAASRSPRRMPRDAYSNTTFQVTTADHHTIPLVRPELSDADSPTLNDEVLLHWQGAVDGSFVSPALAARVLVDGSPGTSPQRQTASPATAATESPSPSSTVPAASQAAPGPMPASYR
jgi:hypothetical protein